MKNNQQKYRCSNIAITWLLAIALLLINQYCLAGIQTNDLNQGSKLWRKNINKGEQAVSSGRYFLALKYFNKAVSDLSTFPAKLQQTAVSNLRLCETHKKLNYLHLAKQYCLQAFVTSNENKFPDAELATRIALEFAKVKYQNKSYSGALKITQFAYKKINKSADQVKLKTKGANYATVDRGLQIQVLLFLTRLHLIAGEFSDANRYTKKARQLIIKNYGDRHLLLQRLDLELAYLYAEFRLYRLTLAIVQSIINSKNIDNVSDGKPYRVYLLLGDSLSASGLFKQAIHAYRTGLKLTPGYKKKQQARFYQRMAASYELSENIQAASSSCNQLIRLLQGLQLNSVNNQWSLNYLYQCLHLSVRWKQDAILRQLAEVIVALDKSQNESQAFIALYQFSQLIYARQYQLAIEYWRSFMKQYKPGASQLAVRIHNSFAFGLVQAYQQSGKLKNAKRILYKLINHYEKNNLLANRKLALLYSHYADIDIKEKNYSSALVHIEKAIAVWLDSVGQYYSYNIYRGRDIFSQATQLTSLYNNYIKLIAKKLENNDQKLRSRYNILLESLLNRNRLALLLSRKDIRLNPIIESSPQENLTDLSLTINAIDYRTAGLAYLNKRYFYLRTLPSEKRQIEFESRLIKSVYTLKSNASYIKLNKYSVWPYFLTRSFSASDQVAYLQSILKQDQAYVFLNLDESESFSFIIRKQSLEMIRLNFMQAKINDWLAGNFTAEFSLESLIQQIKPLLKNQSIIFLVTDHKLINILSQAGIINRQGSGNFYPVQIKRKQNLPWTVHLISSF